MDQNPYESPREANRPADPRYGVSQTLGHAVVAFIVLVVLFWLFFPLWQTVVVVDRRDRLSTIFSE